MKHPLLLVLGIPGALAAQAPTPVSGGAVAPASFTIPVHTRADAPGEPRYGLWAGGDRYKASFHDGMTFVPLLGAGYPHNQPFAWRTASVRVGATELRGSGRAPATVCGDFRVEYHHGAVVEAYDVRPEGLEQTFVLARRPAATGDLVVRGELATALWTAPVEDVHGDLVFRDADGSAIVGYGRAVAIDADGDAFPMSTSCAGGTITLRLPAASLAAADFPLVVDPLLTAQYVALLVTTVEVGEVDAASEGSAPSLNSAVCYTRHFSATDADVHARLGTPSLTGGGAVFQDVAASASADHPRVAHVAATNRWVLVYENLILASQQRQIRAAMFPGGVAGVPHANSIPHLVAPGTHEWRPVVGGVASGGAGNHALVAFQQDVTGGAFGNTATSKVWAMRLDTSTNLGTWGVPFLVQGGADEDAERPSVNRAAEGGASFSWLVVCQAYANTIAGDDWDLFGRLVTAAGTVSANAWISSLGTMHKLGPVVDGRHGRFCVAFSTAAASVGKTGTVLGNELRCERLDWAHGAASPSAAGDRPAETLQSNQFRILEATGIAHDGASRSHWALAWRSSSTAPALYATRVGFRGKPLQAPDLVAATGVTVPGPAGVLHNELVDRPCVAYQLATPTSAELWARGFDLAQPADVTVSPAACAPMVPSWTGVAAHADENQRIGAELVGPRVHGAPAGGLHLMLVALATTNVPLVDPMFGAGCALLVPFTGPDYLGTMPLAIGDDVSWALPLPEHLPALTLHFQDWVLDPANGRFWGSRRLTVPLVK